MIISPPEKTYRQNLTVRLAALIVPAIAWMVALIIWADEPKPGPISMGVAIGLTALWAAMWYWVGKAELTVHQEGIRRTTAFGAQELMWEEVSETRFTQVPMGQAMAIHFGLIGWLIASKMGNSGGSNQRQLALHAPDGRKLRISANWRDADDAIRIALHRVDPRIKADARRRIQGGEALSFGNVSLSQRGIAWKQKEPIPLATLVKCKIEGAQLRVKAEGKWLDNISVATSKVPNVFVLLDLVDEFRSGGKPSAPDPLLRAGGV